MKKYNVMLDPAKVERLRAVARRRAVLLGRDVNWLMLLRESVDQILAADDQIKHAPLATGIATTGGAR